MNVMDATKIILWTETNTAIGTFKFSSKNAENILNISFCSKENAFITIGTVL